MYEEQTYISLVETYKSIGVFFPMEKQFYEVVTGNHYDLKEASKHIDKLGKDKVKAKDMPSIEPKFIRKHHCGCCLHYGMALFKLMRDAGMECFISISREENPVTHEKTDKHVSVYYIKEGKAYIADPVEAVKTGTLGFAKIPLESFIKENGTVWIFDPYGENGDEEFFGSFMATPLATFTGEE